MARPRIWTRVVSSVVLAFALTACTGGGGQTRGPGESPVTGPPDRRAPVLAFVRPAQHELMMSDAAGRTWQAASLDAPAGGFRWSPDGSRLAWLDAVGESTGSAAAIHVLDVASGEVISSPCSCHGLAFLGQDVAVLSGDGAALLLFPWRREVERIVLSARQPDFSEVAVGGTDRVVVVALLPQDQVLRGERTAVSIDRDGKVRPVLSRDERTSFLQGIQAPDGSHAAWNTWASGGACDGRAGITTLDVTNPDAPLVRVAPDPDDPAFARAGLGDARIVAAFSWAGRGLVVTFAPVGCGALSPSESLSYLLLDGAWRFLGSGWLALAYGAQGRVGMLRPADGVETIRGVAHPLGRLTLADGAGSDIVLGDGVSTFFFTPPEAARAVVATTAQASATSSQVAPR